MNMEISTSNTQQVAPFSPKKKLHVKDQESFSDAISNTRNSIKNGRDISARNLTQCTGATGGIPTLRKPNRNQTTTSTTTDKTTTHQPSAIEKKNSFAVYDPKLAAEYHDGSESTVSEFVALEDEPTEFLSERGSFQYDLNNDDDIDDDEETIIEEVVEEYYVEEEIVQSDDDSDEEEDDDESEDDDEATIGTDGDDFAPLPPPIVIPKALQVKNSDDEEEDDDDTGTYNTNNTSYDDDDESTLESIKKPTTTSSSKKSMVSENVRPDSIRGYSFKDQGSKVVAAAAAATTTTSTKNQNPPTTIVTDKKESIPQTSGHGVNRPDKIRGYSFAKRDDKTNASSPMAAAKTTNDSTENNEVLDTKKKDDDMIPQTSGHGVNRPEKIRGYSFADRENKGSASTTNNTMKTKEQLDVVKEDDGMIPQTSGHGVNRPGKVRGYSFEEPIGKPNTALVTKEVAVQEKKGTANDVSKTTAWEKPDWTKKNHLKSSGVSPTRNLSKPITSSISTGTTIDTPKTSNASTAEAIGDSTSASMSLYKSPYKTPKGKVTSMTPIGTPKKSNTTATKVASSSCTSDQISSMSLCKSPHSPAKGKIISTNAPKSAPQAESGRPKVVASTKNIPSVRSRTTDDSNDKDDDMFDEDGNKKIAWKKPEWTKKNVLRTTSKTEKIYSGGKLERPIGGIRPIDDVNDSK